MTMKNFVLGGLGLFSMLLSVPAMASGAPTVTVVNNTSEALWVTFYDSSYENTQISYGCVPKGTSVSKSHAGWAVLNMNPGVKVDVKNTGATDCSDTRGHQSGLDIMPDFPGSIKNGQVATVTLTDSTHNDVNWRWSVSSN